MELPIIIITIYLWLESCYYLSKNKRSRIFPMTILLALVIWNTSTEVAIIICILGGVFSLIAFGNTFKRNISPYFRD